jgi:hypothetical protein
MSPRPPTDFREWCAALGSKLFFGSVIHIVSNGFESADLVD